MAKDGLSSAWIDRIAGRDGRVYLAIAETIREAIAEGELKPGDALPPHRELAWRLGIATATVSRGYRHAMQWGLLSARVGSGTVVARANEAAPLTLTKPDGLIDMGLLHPARLGSPRFRRRIYADMLAEIGAQWAASWQSYPPELGYEAHRAIGADWLTRSGAPATPETTLVCDGAQQAALLTISLLTRPGDPLLLEAQTYLGFKAVCEATQRHPVAVAIDDKGAVPEALEEAAARSGATLALLTPTLQNPTATVMPESRRREIAQILRKRQLYLFEDDPFAELAGDAAPSPIVSMAPDRVLYARSLSKYAAPTSRAAFLRAPASLIAQIEALKHGLTIGGSGLTAALGVEWLRHGLLPEIVGMQRAEIEMRRRRVEAVAGAALSGSTPVWSPFLWLRLPPPMRGPDLARTLERRGVRALPDERFAVGRAPTAHCLRLALTSERSIERLETAAATVRDALDPTF